LYLDFVGYQAKLGIEKTNNLLLSMVVPRFFNCQKAFNSLFAADLKLSLMHENHFFSKAKQHRHNDQIIEEDSSSFTRVVAADS
jgi:hypothetical protein